MELLIMLSTRPIPFIWVRQELIMDDDQIDDLIHILRSQQFKIVTGKVEGLRCAWIAESGKKDAEAAAWGYIDRIDRD